MRKFAIMAALIGVCTLSAQSEIEKVTETTSKSKIEGHIYFLADDVLKGRETGTPELKIAASYLANSLRGYGVKPNPKTGTYYQDVNLKQVSPPSKVSIEINGNVMNEYAIIVPVAVESQAEAVFMGYGLEEDYAGKNVNGKVILVEAGGPEAADTRAAFGLRITKQELAREHGVLAIIELINTDDTIWGFIDHNFNTPQLTIDLDEGTKGKEKEVAHLWVLDPEGTLANDLSNKAVKVSLSINDKIETPVLSQNVIGVVEGTDPKLKAEYIIYSAHYDHVGIGAPDETGDTIYNGARDNAIGTTTVLSMAENLAKYPTRRSALFILFTGEEKGLLGSKYYVENPVLPLDQMVYCFNSDNGGYNDTSLATIIGLTRTSAEKNISSAVAAFGLKAIDDPAKEEGLFDRSDNVNFAVKGIPSPTFSLGFTAFNGDVTKYYHRPGDEAPTLDYDYLLKFFRSYVLSGRNIANDPATPTWNQGDKYEEVSKELYKVNKNDD